MSKTVTSLTGIELQVKRIVVDREPAAQPIQIGIFKTPPIDADQQRLVRQGRRLARALSRALPWRTFHALVGELERIYFDKRR